MVNVNLGAIVKPVTVAGQGVKKVVGSLVPVNGVLFRENRQKKILKLGRTV